MATVFGATRRWIEIIDELEALEATPATTPEEQAVIESRRAALADAATIADDGVEEAVASWADQRAVLKGSIGVLKERAKWYAEKARRMAAYIERVDKLAIEAMERTGREKITSDGVKITVRYSEAVEVAGEVESLPQEAIKVKTVVTPVKAELKRLIKAGVDVPGVSLVERASLRVS